MPRKCEGKLAIYEYSRVSTSKFYQLGYLFFYLFLLEKVLLITMKFYSQVVFSIIVYLFKKITSYLFFFYSFFTFRFHFLYIIEQVNSNRSGRRYEKETSRSSLLVNWFFPFTYFICSDFWTNDNRNRLYKNGKNRCE